MNSAVISAFSALFGAGLDVFDEEPGNPLLKPYNVVRSARAKCGMRPKQTSKISRTGGFLQGSLQLNRQDRLSNECNRLA
jgi:hypothetical protein